MNRNEAIFKRIKEHYNYLKHNYSNYNVIYLGLQGSQNYELDTYTDEYQSDVDTKAIVVPSLRDIACNKQPVSTTIVLPNNEHIDVKDIRLMMDNFKKQNINFIEILFTKFRIINKDYKDLILELINMGEDIAHLNENQALRCMSGMSMEKKKALCHPYPSLIDRIEKYGYDGKQLHHIIRMNDFIKAYTSGKSYRECLTSYSDKDLLMDAKLNKFSLEEALDLSNRYDENTKLIKDKFLKEQDIVNKQTLNDMNDIQYRIIKRCIEKELQPEEIKEIDPNTYHRVFVISDTHFGHENILDFENRREKMILPDNATIEDHDTELIERWNNTVNKNDLVYILGDFSFYKYDKTTEILNQLNGDKVLIEGNHDMIYLENKKFNRSIYKEISSYKEINYKGRGVIMCHYPISHFKHENKEENGYIHLFGHIHSVPFAMPKRSYNVGADVNDYTPVLLDIAIERALKNTSSGTLNKPYKEG